jgi:hypothetical protein
VAGDRRCSGTSTAWRGEGGQESDMSLRRPSPEGHGCGAGALPLNRIGRGRPKARPDPDDKKWKTPPVKRGLAVFSGRE